MHRDKEKLAQSGNYGSEKVHSTNILRAFVGQSKLSYENKGEERVQVEAVRKRLENIYHNYNGYPPDSFVQQMGFTSMNGFLLTTDGRLFSWGCETAALGREIIQHKNDELKRNIKNMVNPQRDYIDVGEVVFSTENPEIVKIATGKHHVLALDSKGNVWSWGKNDRGQTGLSLKPV